MKVRDTVDPIEQVGTGPTRRCWRLRTETFTSVCEATSAHVHRRRCVRVVHEDLGFGCQSRADRAVKGTDGRRKCVLRAAGARCRGESVTRVEASGSIRRSFKRRTEYRSRRLRHVEGGWSRRTSAGMRSPRGSGAAQSDQASRVSFVSHSVRRLWRSRRRVFGQRRGNEPFPRFAVRLEAGRRGSPSSVAMARPRARAAGRACVRCLVSRSGRTRGRHLLGHADADPRTQLSHVSVTRGHGDRLSRRRARSR